MYRSDDGRAKFAINPPYGMLGFSNVGDVYKMPFGYVAITGVSHLDISEGAIYSSSGANNSGQPFRFEILAELPAAPSSHWLLQSGDLLINMRGGSMLLTRDAGLKPVRCKE